jgi:hypothetical protein
MRQCDRVCAVLVPISAICRQTSCYFVVQLVVLRSLISILPRALEYLDANGASSAASTIRLFVGTIGMRLHVVAHLLSVDPGEEWTAEPIEPGSEHLGAYLRSNEHGVYLNVRRQDSGTHPLTEAGLLGLLREQNWGPKIDEWTARSGALVIAGGSFETVGMGGEVVLEIFVTDGRRVANLVGPGQREVITALRAAAEQLAGTVRFE